MIRIVRILPILISVTLRCQMIAQCAFFHNALSNIVLAHPVGTGIDAILAADAFVLVDEHDIVVRVAVRGSRGTHAYAGRVLALLTIYRQPVHLGVGVLTGGANANNTAPIVAQIYVVFELAGNNTGVAARTPVKVDY
jgi:hypothetical protein